MTIKDGTRVQYHGSLTEYHGPAEVIGHHPPYSRIDESDTVRYVLQYGPDEQDYLTNVRPSSFTVEVEPNE
jgi:hypothetical protein